MIECTHLTVEDFCNLSNPTKNSVSRNENDVITVTPIHIKFPYDNVLAHVVPVTIWNKSKTHVRFRLILPQTDIFQVYCDQVNLFANSEVTIYVKCKPRDTQICVDCFEIQTPCQSGIRVLLELLPGIDWFVLPKFVSLPIATLDKRVEGKITLPVPSGNRTYDFCVVSPLTPIFNVSPRSGTIGGMDGVQSLTVVFLAHEYLTLTFKLQIKFPGVESQPYEISVFGQCVPNLENESLRQDICQIEKLTSSLVQKKDTKSRSKQPRFKLKNVPKEKDQNIFRGGVDTQGGGDTFGNDKLFTPAGVMKFLLQKDDAATLLGPLGVPMSVSRAIYNQKKMEFQTELNLVKSKQANLSILHRVERNGDEAIESQPEALEQILLEREKHVMEYHKALGMEPNMSEDLTRLQIKKVNQRQIREAGDLPKPRFGAAERFTTENYLRDLDFVRKQTLRPFIQAGRILMLRYRADQRIKKLRILIRDYHKIIEAEEASKSKPSTGASTYGCGPPRDEYPSPQDYRHTKFIQRVQCQILKTNMGLINTRLCKLRQKLNSDLDKMKTAFNEDERQQSAIANIHFEPEFENLKNDTNSFTYPQNLEAEQSHPEKIKAYLDHVNDALNKLQDKLKNSQIAKEQGKINNIFNNPSPSSVLLYSKTNDQQQGGDYRDMDFYLRPNQNYFLPPGLTLEDMENHVKTIYETINKLQDIIQNDTISKVHSEINREMDSLIGQPLFGGYFKETYRPVTVLEPPLSENSKQKRNSVLTREKQPPISREELKKHQNKINTAINELQGQINSRPLDFLQNQLNEEIIKLLGFSTSSDMSLAVPDGDATHPELKGSRSTDLYKVVGSSTRDPNKSSVENQTTNKKPDPRSRWKTLGRKLYSKLPANVSPSQVRTLLGHVNASLDNLQSIVMRDDLNTNHRNINRIVGNLLGDDEDDLIPTNYDKLRRISKIRAEALKLKDVHYHKKKINDSIKKLQDQLANNNIKLQKKKINREINYLLGLSPNASSGESDDDFITDSSEIKEPEKLRKDLDRINSEVARLASKHNNNELMKELQQQINRKFQDQQLKSNSAENLTPLTPTGRAKLRQSILAEIDATNKNQKTVDDPFSSDLDNLKELVKEVLALKEPSIPIAKRKGRIRKESVEDPGRRELKQFQSEVNYELNDLRETYTGPEIPTLQDQINKDIDKILLSNKQPISKPKLQSIRDKVREQINNLAQTTPDRKMAVDLINVRDRLSDSLQPWQGQSPMDAAQLKQVQGELNKQLNTNKNLDPRVKDLQERLNAEIGLLLNSPDDPKSDKPISQEQIQKVRDRFRDELDEIMNTCSKGDLKDDLTKLKQITGNLFQPKLSSKKSPPGFEENNLGILQKFQDDINPELDSLKAKYDGMDAQPLIQALQDRTNKKIQKVLQYSRPITSEDLDILRDKIRDDMLKLKDTTLSNEGLEMDLRNLGQRTNQLLSDSLEPPYKLRGEPLPTRQIQVLQKGLNEDLDAFNLKYGDPKIKGFQMFANSELKNVLLQSPETVLGRGDIQILRDKVRDTLQKVIRNPNNNNNNNNRDMIFDLAKLSDKIDDLLATDGARSEPDGLLKLPSGVTEDTVRANLAQINSEINEFQHQVMNPEIANIQKRINNIVEGIFQPAPTNGAHAQNDPQNGGDKNSTHGGSNSKNEQRRPGSLDSNGIDAFPYGTSGPIPITGKDMLRHRDRIFSIISDLNKDINDDEVTAQQKSINDEITRLMPTDSSDYYYSLSGNGSGSQKNKLSLPMNAQIEPGDVQDLKDDIKEELDSIQHHVEDGSKSVLDVLRSLDRTIDMDFDGSNSGSGINGQAQDFGQGSGRGQSFGSKGGDRQARGSGGNKGQDSEKKDFEIDDQEKVKNNQGQGTKATDQGQGDGIIGQDQSYGPAKKSVGQESSGKKSQGKDKEGSGNKGGLGQGPNGPHELGPEHGINGQEKAGGFGIKAEGPLANGHGQSSDTAISTGTGTGKTGEQGLTPQNGDRVIDKNRLNTYKNALKDGMDQLHTLTKDPRVQQLETKSVKELDALLKSEPGTHIQLDKVKELQNKTKNSLAAIRHDLPTIHSNAKVASGLKNLHKDFEDFFGQPLDQTNKNGAPAPTGAGTKGKHAAGLAPKNMKSLTHAELKHFRNHMTHKIDQLLAHSDDPKLRKTKEHIQEHINALLQLQSSTHHAQSHGGKVSQEAFLKLRDRVHAEIENIQQKVLNNEVTMHLFSLKKVINNMFGTTSGLKTPTKPKLKVQQQRISHALDRLYGLDGPISDAIVHDAQQKINEQFEETYLSAGDPVTTEDDITHKKIIGLQNIIQHEMDDLKNHITNPKIRDNMDKISHTLESFLQRASPRHSADISVDIKTVEDKLAKEFDKFSAKHHPKGGGKDSHHKIKQAKSKILSQAQRLGKDTNEAPNPVQMKNLLNNIHSEIKHLKDLTPNTNKAKIKDINELDHNVDVIFNQGHGKNMNRAELQEYQKLINDQFDDLATETGGSDENVKLARKKINEEIEKLLLSKSEAKPHGHGHPSHASVPAEDKFHQLHQHIKHDMESLEKHISGVKPNGPHITEQLAAINHGLLQKYLTTKHHHHPDEPHHHGHDEPLTEFLDKITKEYTKQHETHGIKDIKSTLKKITDQVHKFLHSNNKHHNDNKNEHIKDSKSSSKLTNLPPHDHPNELKAKLNTLNAEVGELQNKIHNESIKQSQKIINNNINARINNNPVNPNAALKSDGKSPTVSATEKPPIITIGRPEIIQHQAKINTKLNNLQDILKNRDIDAQQQIINTAFNKLLELEKPLIVPTTKTTPTPKTTINNKTEESDLLSKTSLSTTTTATASQIMSTASAAGLFVKVDIVRARDEVNEAMNEFLGVLPNKEIDETRNRINNIVDNLTKKYEREKLVTEKKARKLAKLHAEMSQILGLTNGYNADEVASSSSRPKKFIKENKLNKSGATAANNNNNNPIPKEVVEQHQAKINDQFEKFLKRLPNVDVLKNQIKLNQVLDNLKGQKLNDPRNFKAKPLFDTEFKKLPKITMDELLQFKVDIGAEINKLQDKVQSQDIKDAKDSFNGIMDKLVDNIQVPLVAPSKEDEKSLLGESSTNSNHGGEEEDEDGEDSEAKILIPSLVLRKHLTNFNAQFENILDLGHVRKKRRVTKAITQVQNSFNSTFSQLFETVIKDGVIPMTKPEIIHFINEINESYKAAPELVKSTVFLEKVEGFNEEMQSFISKLESDETAKATLTKMQNATKPTPPTNDKILPHALEVAAMTQLKIINNQVKDLQGKIGNKELALLTKALNLNLVNKLKLPAAPSSENFDIEFTGSLIILEDTKSASGKKRGVVGESGGVVTADKKRDSGVTYEKVSPSQFQNYLKNINDSYSAIPDKFKTTSLTNVKDKMTQLLGSLELDAKTELINTNLNKINANMDQLKLLGLAPENKKNITSGTGTAGDDELDEVSQLQQLLNNALRAPLGLDVPLSAEAGNKTDEKNAADMLQKLLTKEDLKSLGPTPDSKRLSSDKLDQTQANLEALLQEIGKLPDEMKTDALKPIEKVLRKKLENIQRQQELYKVPLLLEKINKEINALQSKVQKPELFKLQHKLNSHLNEIISRTGAGHGNKSSFGSDDFKLAPFAFELEPSSFASSASLTPSPPKAKIQIEDLRKHKEKIMDEINNLPEVVKTGEFHRTKNAINTFLKELQRQIEKENSKFPGSELAEDIAKLQEKVDQEFKTLEMKLIGEAQAVSKTGFFDVRKPAQSNSAAAHRQNLFRTNINKQVTSFHDRIHYETSKLREKVKHTKNFTSSMKNVNLKILGDVDETVENEIKWLLDLVNELLATSQSEITPISKTMKYPPNRDSLSLNMGHHQEKSSRSGNKFGAKSSNTGYSHLHRPKTRGRDFGRSIISGKSSQFVAAPKSVSQFTTTKGKFIPFVTKSSYQMKKPKGQNNNKGRLDTTPKVSGIPLPQTTSSLIQQPTKNHRTIGSHDYLQSRFFLSEASAQAILNELKISKQKAKHGNIKAYQL